MHNYIGCICLVFLHCVFLNVSSNVSKCHFSSLCLFSPPPLALVSKEGWSEVRNLSPSVFTFISAQPSWGLRPLFVELWRRGKCCEWKTPAPISSYSSSARFTNVMQELQLNWANVCVCVGMEGVFLTCIGSGRPVSRWEDYRRKHTWQRILPKWSMTEGYVRQLIPINLKLVMTHWPTHSLTDRGRCQEMQLHLKNKRFTL